MIEKTSAVVLKSMKYRDTSKIVTLYTRRFGRLSCLAKGARQLTSKFGASLEPMTESEIVFYKSEGRDLHLLSQSSTLRPFKKLHSQGEKIAIGFSVLELVNRLAHEQEEHQALYALLIDALEALEHSERNFVNILYAFELRFSALHGFAPSFKACANCGRALGSADEERVLPFLLDKGAAVCPECREAMGQVLQVTQATGALAAGGAAPSRLMVPLRASARRVLERLLDSPLESVCTLHYDAAVGNDLDETLRLYLQYHFENFRPLKSPGIFGLSTGQESPEKR